MRQIQMSILAWLAVGVLFVTAGSSFADAAEFQARNLAKEARITANSAYSPKYVAQLVADDQIPAAGQQEGSRPGRGV